MLPKEVKDNFWITDIDSFDNVRNLINVEADNGKWVLVGNFDTHIVDATNMYEKVALSEYQHFIIYMLFQILKNHIQLMELTEIIV